MRRAVEFARDRLGPASERVLANAAAQTVVLSRARGGATLEDAVLGVIHGRTAGDRDLANEFLAYFLGDVMRTGRGLVSPRLRGFLDTCDLAQSVLGDLWPQLTEITFESSGSFLALLRTRLSWKASNRARGARHAGEADRPARRVDGDTTSTGLDVPDDAPGPGVVAELREEEERMLLALTRLSERDRVVLRSHLAGEAASAIARRLGVSLAAAEKALSRSKRRARQLLEKDDAMSRASETSSAAS